MDHQLWEETFRIHLVALENFQRGRKPLSGENTVYLAGMIARELDDHYRENTRAFLVRTPDEIDRAVRSHDPYIGQNAPIVTLSRINAEHLTFEIAVSRVHRAHLRIPARYFAIAAYYSYQAGKPSLAKIYSSFRSNLGDIASLVSDYFRYMLQNKPEEKISKEIMKRFASVTNERNAVKDWRESLRFKSSKKTSVSMHELSEMMNFGRGN